MTRLWNVFLDLVGLESSPVSHTERLVSAAGGFVGIACILIVATHYLDSRDATLIVASMGASAVLLFAVPHGALTQPWSVAGGHLVSATVGVACARAIPNGVASAALAVGLAIGVMHYLRCIHPPGGATALTAVVGGAEVQALGFEFVLTPVLLNLVVILGVAIAFNYFLPWRRYPAALHRAKTSAERVAAEEEPYGPISHADLVFALSEIDSFIDVTEHDLLRIYDLATQRHMTTTPLSPEQIEVGRYYTNGRFDDQWSVREVNATGVEDGTDTLAYTVTAGAGQGEAGTCARSDFARWARAEAILHNGNWLRVDIHLGRRDSRLA